MCYCRYNKSNSKLRCSLMDSSDDNCYLIPKNTTKIYETLCSVILEKNSPLSNCHINLDPDKYFRNCVQNLCYSNDNDELQDEIVVCYV